MNMKRQLLCIVLCLVVLALILLSGGCLDRSAAGQTQDAAVTGKTTPGTVLKDLGTATASAAVIANLKPFFTSGWVLLIGGGLLAVLGGWSTGIMVVGVGVASVITGTLLAQYPWVALAIAALALLAGGMEIVGRWKSRKAIQEHNEAEVVVTKAIQTAGDDVKAAIKDQGVEAVKTVRKVFDPIREKLGLTGKA